MGPPLEGANTWAPRIRSAASPNRAEADLGNAINTSTPVMRMFQENTGSRNIVIPGARMVSTVVMRLTEPRIVPNPVNARPITHRSPPAPGESADSDRGVYPVHP